MVVNGQQPFYCGRRAQFELLGLTFIVLLVMLGVLFGLYVMMRPEKQITRDFSESTLASSWIATYKGITTKCHDATITQLLTDCATSQAIDCDGKNSCDFAAEISQSLAAKTLGEWKRVYNLSVSGPGGVRAISASTEGWAQKCYQKERQTEEQPIPTGAGRVVVRLILCGN